MYPTSPFSNPLVGVEPLRRSSIAKRSACHFGCCWFVGGDSTAAWKRVDDVVVDEEIDLVSPDDDVDSDLINSRSG